MDRIENFDAIFFSARFIVNRMSKNVSMGELLESIEAVKKLLGILETWIRDELAE